VKETEGESLKSFAWLPVCATAFLKIAIHLFAIQRYGYFRDELYYLASTHHLGPGYVDHPPLSILILALQTALFGDSLVSIRMLPVLSGVAVLFLAALIARELGGGRFAQGLAAFCVLCSPALLGNNHYYSMNSWDELFWTLIVFLLVYVLRREKWSLWPVFGLVFGFGLLNKISVLWLGAGIVAGLLLTPERRLLRTKGPWIAGTIAILIFSPYIIWNLRNGLPTLEFMKNASEMKMTNPSIWEFLKSQILYMNPAALPVWVAGLAWCFLDTRGRRWKILAIIYFTVFAILIIGPRKAGYMVPIYPMLFGIGGVALQQWLTVKPFKYLKPVLVAACGIFAAIVAPLAIPLLTVNQFIAYASKLGFTPPAEERHRMGVLPQHFADMFGWDEMAQKVLRAYNTLTPDEKAHCIIFGQNYGEAGAIDVLGRKMGLPGAVSGHNSYWFWGPGNNRVDVVIIIGGDPPDNAEFFKRVDIVDQITCSLCMPYERNINISIGRKPKQPLQQVWPALKQFI
jgi:Dolichyl-phosphate-mannose-protein mannosyltransferase